MQYEYENILERVIYNINNMKVDIYPYPHFYVENIFPEDFYADLLQNWPDDENFMTIGETGRVTGSYENRFVIPVDGEAIKKHISVQKQNFWIELDSWLRGQKFLDTLISKFTPYIKANRDMADFQNTIIRPDVLLVKDHTKYQISPHTDAPHRVVTMLFYCPEDNSQEDLGTSIYVPKDKNFNYQISGNHLPREEFYKISTAKFKPNSLFGFVVTPTSLHGIDEITRENVKRNLMLYIAKAYIQN